jgi:hypothetical protein
MKVNNIWDVKINNGNENITEAPCTLYNDDEMMSPCLFVSSTYLMQ